MSREFAAISFVLGALIGWVANDAIGRGQEQQAPTVVECVCTCATLGRETAPWDKDVKLSR